MFPKKIEEEIGNAVVTLLKEHGITLGRTSSQDFIPLIEKQKPIMDNVVDYCSNSKGKKWIQKRAMLFTDTIKIYNTTEVNICNVLYFVGVYLFQL